MTAIPVCIIPNPDTLFMGSTFTYAQVFEYGATGGNAWFQLGRAYIAVEVSGANTNPIKASYREAEGLLMRYGPYDAMSEPDLVLAGQLTQILLDFNAGLASPACPIP